MHADQGGCTRTVHAFHFYLDFRGAMSGNTCHNDSVGSDSPQRTSIHGNIIPMQEQENNPNHLLEHPLRSKQLD